MIIISDCIRDNLDEGCIKVASTLSKKLQDNGAKIVSVNCKCKNADAEIFTNPLYVKRELFSVIKSFDGDILYIPFASNTLGSAIRTFLLSLFSSKKVYVLFTLRWDMNTVTKLFLKLSKASVLTLSSESEIYFSNALKKLAIYNFQTGVDSTKFKEVSSIIKKELRIKYKIPLDKTVLLHVGHLKHERNIDTFLNVDSKYHVVLVFSSVTEKDNELKSLLLAKDNVQIIESYIPNIEEIYQASDLYVFPIVEENNSIDIPLSVLEAAACNLKILTTPYKEIKYFKKQAGFFVTDNIGINNLNDTIEKIDTDYISTRNIALEYDWNNAVEKICSLIK